MRLFAFLGSFLLVSVAAVSAFVILQACALRLPILSELTKCEPQAELSARQRLAALSTERSALQQRIFDLERELSAAQCVAIPYDPEAPLGDDFWNSRDLGYLRGCWDLDSTYRTRDVDTGAIRSYSQWQMCFDTQGNGTQVMRSGDGIVCEGAVKAGFVNEELGFTEPGNMMCSDGGYIHQRQIGCTRADGGTAMCSTVQPETGGEGNAGFRRAVR